jgi:hypothetical protein
MKRKILALGLFSLCCLALFAGESRAFYGLLSPYNPNSLWHRHNRYVTQITCRPYNAFTPICWGNIVCDGCCPNPCGVAGGCLPMNMGVPPFASMGGCCMPNMGGCCAPGMGGGCMPGMGGACGPDYSHASDMPMMQPQMMQQQPMQPMPDIRSQPFSPPMPMPMPSGPNISMAYPQNGVSQANYYPSYYPMYAPQYPNYYLPTYYNPYQQNMQPAPSYWYGSGR